MAPSGSPTVSGLRTCTCDGRPWSTPPLETGPPFASGGPPRVARTSPRGPAWIAAALEFLVPALFAMGALVGVGGLFNTWRERRGQGAAEGAES